MKKNFEDIKAILENNFAATKVVLKDDKVVLMVPGYRAFRGVPVEILEEMSIRGIIRLFDEIIMTEEEQPVITAAGLEDNLFAALVSTKRVDVTNLPHKMVGNSDLAVIARYKIGDGDSLIVTNGIAEEINVHGMEVIRTAMENTANKGACSSSINQILFGDDSDGPFSVLSMKQEEYGAVVAAFDSVLKTVYERIGNFYIIPSSAHELLVVDRYNAMCVGVDGLNAMVQEVNDLEVAEEDQLSDHVYYFNGNILCNA